MPNPRLFLLMSLAFVGVLLWQAWQQDYGTPPPARTSAPEQTPTGPTDAPPFDTAEMPSSTEVAGAIPESSPATEAAGSAITTDGRLVDVRTDVLHVVIDTQGGNVVRAELLAYPETVEQPDVPVTLLNQDPARYFVAQSGLVGRDAPAPDHRTVYQTDRSRYDLQGDTLDVDLTWSADGVEVVKRLSFARGDYAIRVSYRVRNNTGNAWAGSEYRQLQRVDVFAGESAGFTDTERYSFFGAATYDPENRYEKIDLDDLGDQAVRITSAGSWMAMVQHYFVTSWIPDAEQVNRYESAILPAGAALPSRSLIRQMAPALQVAPGAEGQTTPATLYVGPKLQDRLERIAPGLDLTVDYGILTPFSKILFWLLEKIHSVVGNWGWAIVLLTMVIKAAFFKLSEAQYKSMARMRKLQPRIAALRERYGDDKAKLNQAMMDLYKKEKANPLGGCLPLLVQIPVFIALYWVLLESVELRQAPFVLWIKNLSVPDPFFILPVINGVAMFLTSKLSPAPGMDPMQQKIMTYMPVAFAVLFAFFPAGLVLYWTVNSVLSLAQQWFIIRRFERAEAR